MENKVYNIEYIKLLLTPVFESYDVKKQLSLALMEKVIQRNK